MPPTTSHKRKLPLGGLQRRVRARREEPEPELEEYGDDSQDEGSEDGDLDGMSDSEGDIASESDSASGSEDEDGDGDEEDDPSSAVAEVSFGALAKAQASMPSIRQKKKGRRRVTDDEHEHEGEEEERENDRHPSKPDSKPPKPQRSSKHAPTEMSSKRMVSRKRDVISAPKVLSRDPRFSSASGAIDEARARTAYAFLDEYRESEMAELRASIRKSKSEAEREELGRALKAMQSRRETQARRDAERDLVAQHRREEKGLVAQGKKPFYLKKSEQKRRLLVDRFAGMKKKQVDRAIERRRKKLTAKERKNMPLARRGAA